MEGRVSESAKRRYEIAFPGSDHRPILLDEGSNLARSLSVENSPLLFGCRSGICGTCLSEVTDVSDGSLPPISPEERELLDIIAPGNKKARLACQINVKANLCIRPLSE